jgi:ATP-binding protein involved in chromosome partitioning
MSFEKTKIVKALASVQDPTTGQDIITRNMVRDLEVDGTNINFTIELPNLNNEYKSNLNFACIEAIQKVYPNANVNIHLMGSGSQVNQKPTSPLPHVKNVIAVASGKGGVGKSTIASNLALGLRQTGAKVGLIDADLYGPSIPTMFGLVGQRPKIQHIHGQPKMLPLYSHDIPVMSIGFIIEPQQAVVLRGPRLSGVIKQFIAECIWPELDYLIIDLPPGTGDIQLTLVQTLPLTGAVLVTTPQEVALADAIKAMNMFLMPSVNVPILGVVENMSWFTPEELPDNQYFLFGKGGGKKLAEMSESVLLGQIPIVQSIREAGDTGIPQVIQSNQPSSSLFREIAIKVMERINFRNSNMAPTRIVNVSE